MLRNALSPESKAAYRLGAERCPGHLETLHLTTLVRCALSTQGHRNSRKLSVHNELRYGKCAEPAMVQSRVTSSNNCLPYETVAGWRCYSPVIITSCLA